MKRFLSIILSTVLAGTLLVGCGGEKKEATNADGNKEVTVKMFQFKVEIAEQLAAMKKEYEKEHPGVKIEIETVGGGADYGAALKAKFASGEEPDIFNNGGFSDLDIWADKLEDLSGESWTKNLVEGAGEPMTKDGKIYGQPMNIEGYGFIYNKDLFKKAGITEVPKTLGELREAAKKLKAAGIQAFSNGYQEWWILGLHTLNVGLAQQEDPDKFIADVKAGKQNFKDNKVFNEWVDLLDLTLEYGGGKKTLTTDYNTQVTDFASGKAAMMQQGNWTQAQINKINPDIKLGLMPMPINNNKLEKIFVGVPNNWVVNKKSKVKKEAKEFLNWMVTSEVGKKYITKEFKFIPAFTNITADAKDLGDIAAAVQEYSKEKKVLTWNWFKLPDGAGQEIGNSIQGYIAKERTKDEMLDSFAKIIKNLNK